MRKIATVLAFCLLAAAAFAGCGIAGRVGASDGAAFQDGAYMAEMKEFDSHGYKDFVEATVSDGVVTKIVFDAKDVDGNLRSQDAEYRASMEKVENTYPEKYTADLANQYLQAQNADEVVAVAGATYSSDSFRALFKALETSMRAGNTDTLLVDNVPEK